MVKIYIQMLMSSELLVLINFTICGTPEIKKSMPGK